MGRQGWTVEGAVVTSVWELFLVLDQMTVSLRAWSGLTPQSTETACPALARRPREMRCWAGAELSPFLLYRQETSTWRASALAEMAGLGPGSWSLKAVLSATPLH